MSLFFLRVFVGWNECPRRGIGSKQACTVFLLSIMMINGTTFEEASMLSPSLTETWDNER
jgi:hypothetical protein